MKTSSRKRVLMLLENNPYCQDIRVIAEASALTQAGYHVTVVSPAARGTPRHEVLDGVVTYSYPAPPVLDGILGFVWEYGYSVAASFLLSLFIFVRHGFDVVHAHNPPDLYVFVAAFYKLFGVRFVFDHHDLSPEMYCARFGGRSRRLVYRVLVAVEKLSCRMADHIIATNESYRAVEMERGGVPRERITIVRNGPDLTRTRRVEPDPALRSMGKTVIGYVGEMGFQDGIDYLLRALHVLVYDLGRTDFFCVLIGKGAAGKQLKALATALGIDEHVHFTGWVSEADLLSYLCAADICVDPDPSNPFNDRSSMIKMSEYMTLGKPIVAFDLPEHRFTAQEAALYARANDETAFAKALAELMDDPARREAMGAFGRERVESTLAWSYSVSCLLDAYSRLPLGRSPQVSTPPPPVHIRMAAKLRQWVSWRRERSVGYIVRRGTALVQRYGVTPPKAERRILDCVRKLANHGCRPTFPIPGALVDKYGEFTRTLQAMGAELAIHGYEHVDFRSLSSAEAGHQFVKAGEVFREQRIRAHGYRCPYLSATEELHQSVPDGLVQYSSNDAIWWEDVPGCDAGNTLFDTLRRFYRAESSQAAVAMPRWVNGLVEIPVSLPDDLQLSDGLNLDPAGIQQAWTAMLHHIHGRGELFVVLFHPESYDRCAQAFDRMLDAARRMQPAVWITQLRDVSRWWREKAAFTVERSRRFRRLRIRFHCSPRATVLVRNLDAPDGETWCGGYQVLNGRTLDVPTRPRPFVGLAPDVADRVAAFLTEQGYILERGEAAEECGVFLDAGCLERLDTDVKLVEHIECSPAPLVRFWRWPDRYRSALCVSGDIDALTLVDYAARLLPGLAA